MGEPGHPDRGREFADPDRQPFQGHAGAVAATASRSRARSIPARSPRHQGTGKRQAGAGGRRRRRSSPADGRLARRGQIDAGGAAAVDPAAAVAARVAPSLDDRFRRRRDRGRSADGPAAIPCTASLRQHGRADRRRHARPTRRDIARASRRAVSRRVAGVRSARTGFAAAAAGKRRGRGVPRQPSRHLSRALHAGRGDESVPVRQRL